MKTQALYSNKSLSYITENFFKVITFSFNKAAKVWIKKLLKIASYPYLFVLALFPHSFILDGWLFQVLNSYESYLPRGKYNFKYVKDSEPINWKAIEIYLLSTKEETEF